MWSGIIFSNSKIVSAIPLQRFARENFGLPLAYSRVGVVFLICSKMAFDLLDNFQAKNLQFQSQFS